MGNQTSLQESSQLKNIANNYTFEKKFVDSRFGEIKLLSEKETGKKIFQKDISSQSQKDFEKFAQELKERAALAHPNLLRVLGLATKKEDLFCANFYKISLYFESYDEDLEQDITKRAEKKDYIEEIDLWYMIDSVVSGLAFLEENKVSHGDLRPYNIFVSNQGALREFKTCDIKIFQPNYGTLAGGFEALEAKSHYPGPQLLKVLSNPEKPGEYDPVKNDVFSFALTIIETALLEKLEGVYDWEKYTFNFEKLEKYLETLRNKYSDTLYQTLKFMLKAEEAERPTFQALEREFLPYRADIRNSVNVKSGGEPLIDPEEDIEDELERRVREAIRRSEDTISRSSPKKYKTTIDPIVNSYMNNEPIQDDKVFQALSPYISLESKYTPTLYQNPGQTDNVPQTPVREDKAQVYSAPPVTTTNTSAPTGANDILNLYGLNLNLGSTSTANQSSTVTNNATATNNVVATNNVSSTSTFNINDFLNANAISSTTNNYANVSSTNVNNNANTSSSNTFTNPTQPPSSAVNYANFTFGEDKKETTDAPSFSYQNQPVATPRPLESSVVNIDFGTPTPAQNYNFGTTFAQTPSNDKAGQYSAYNYGTTFSQTTTSNAQGNAGNQAFNIDSILEKTKTVEMTNTYQTTTVSAANYQFSSTDGKPIDTADLVRQVTETLKKSQALVQNPQQ